MNVEKLLTRLDRLEWKTDLTDGALESLCRLQLRGDSYELAAIAGELAANCQPITLRGLFYRIVSTGYFPSTDKAHYDKVGRLLCTLRRSGWIPYSWIVDNIRSTRKPSSWSGLEDFADTVRGAYRKDFWSSLPTYVHIFIEKDAMTGVIQPVTDELDVPLSPVRGYVSDSYAHSIGSEWKRIAKPIYAFYIGDFDPSGFDLERSLREKLREHSGRSVPVDECWHRIALNASDFDEHNLFELAPKKSDSRTKKFIEQHGSRCAEVDALDPNVIRQRVRDAVMGQIPAGAWERLQEVERVERETWMSTLGSLTGGADQ